MMASSSVDSLNEKMLEVEMEEGEIDHDDSQGNTEGIGELVRMGMQKKRRKKTSRSSSQLSSLEISAAVSPFPSPSPAPLSPLPVSLSTPTKIEVRLVEMEEKLVEMERVVGVEKEGMYVWLGQFAKGCQGAIDDVTSVEEEIIASMEELKGELNGLRDEVTALGKRIDERTNGVGLHEIVEDTNESGMEEMMRNLRMEFRLEIDKLTSAHHLESIAAQESIGRLERDLQSLRTEISERDHLVVKVDETALPVTTATPTNTDRQETLDLVDELLRSRVAELGGSPLLDETVSTALNSLLPPLLAKALPQALEESGGKLINVLQKSAIETWTKISTILPLLHHLNTTQQTLSSTSQHHEQRLDHLSTDFEKFQRSIKMKFGNMSRYEDERMGMLTGALEKRFDRDEVVMDRVQKRLEEVWRRDRGSSRPGEETNHVPYLVHDIVPVLNRDAHNLVVGNQQPNQETIRTRPLTPIDLISSSASSDRPLHLNLSGPSARTFPSNPNLPPSPISAKRPS